MSVIACFHQLSVSAPVNIPHFSEPLGRAGSRVNQFWGFALQRVNFENVTGLRRNRLISILIDWNYMRALDNGRLGFKLNLLDRFGHSRFPLFGAVVTCAF